MYLIVCAETRPTPSVQTMATPARRAAVLRRFLLPTILHTSRYHGDCKRDAKLHWTIVEVYMVLTAASLSPVLAILFGILIFIFPRLLNYLVALYLVLSGLIGL